MPWESGAIVSKLTLDRSKFSASIKGVQKQTRTLGGWVKKNSAQFKRMGMAITAMGAAALLTFKKMVKQYVEVGDMVDKMSKRTGFAAETLSELAYAADISGADLSVLEKGVKSMAKTIAYASDGLETYLREFRKIGISVDDLMKLNPEQQFLKIAEGISAIEHASIRSASAQVIFGRAGMMLLPLFAEGAEGMKKLREEAHIFSYIFDKEAAAAAAALKDEQTRLTGSVKGLSMAILTDLIPIITNVTKSFTDWFVKSREGAKTWTDAFISFFKTIVKGIEGLMLAWGAFKVFVFEMGDTIVRHLAVLTAGIVIVTGYTKKMGILGKTHEAAKGALKDLMTIGISYSNETSKQIEKLTEIIIWFDNLTASLNKVKVGYDTATEAEKSFGSALTEIALPAARDMTGVLAAVQGQMESTAYASVTGSKMAVGAMAKQEAALASAAMAYQSGLGGIMSAIKMVTIGEFLKSLATAKIPFLAKLAMTGIVVGLVSAVFAGLMKGMAPKKGFARGGHIEEEGGIVGERGPELFVPERPGFIVPARETRELLGRPRVLLQFSPVFYLSTLDPLTARDVVREQIGPELIDMLKAKILLPEFQEALGTK